jgi:hypothetical protein
MLSLLVSRLAFATRFGRIFQWSDGVELSQRAQQRSAMAPDRGRRS